MNNRKRSMRPSKILFGIGTVSFLYLARMVSKRVAQSVSEAGTNKVIGIIDGAVSIIDRTKDELGKIVSEFMDRNEPSKGKIESTTESIEEMARVELSQLKEKITYLEEQLSKIKNCTNEEFS